MSQDLIVYLRAQRESRFLTIKRHEIMMGAAQDVKIAPEARRVLAVIDLYGSLFLPFLPAYCCPSASTRNKTNHLQQSAFDAAFIGLNH